MGNYHAGYTGTYAGVDYLQQWRGAGVAEMLKNHDYAKLFDPATLPPPYGDAWMDFRWNTQGMIDAGKGIGKPGPFDNVPPF